MRTIVIGAPLLFLLLASGPARAFSGFFAGTTEAPLESPASTVVLMRDGDRTAVSAQAQYQGPGARFAWIVPVPPSVADAHVRVVDADVVTRVDQVSAPRLVELVERNPCGAGGARPGGVSRRIAPGGTSTAVAFDADDLVLLGAEDSAALDGWLRRQGYRLSAAARAPVRALVAAGYRFLVARVDGARLALEDGRAWLPPIGFHYRHDELVLPLPIASDRHDLVVHVLARDRYEATNRDDVLAPTNLVLYRGARERLDEVYATILDRVLRRHPGALVTEHAAPTDACEDCSGPPLGAVELDALGRGVLGRRAPASFIHTRLHTWLDGSPGGELGLVSARPIAGGRGRPTPSGTLGHRVERDVTANAFQTRYAILHAWRGPSACAPSARNRWSTLRRRAAIRARRTTQIIPTGRLRNFVHTWPPVLRIPARGDATPASPP